MRIRRRCDEAAVGLQLSAISLSVNVKKQETPAEARTTKGKLWRVIFIYCSNSDHFSISKWESRPYEIT
jgi:hypothetical protein